MHYVTAKGILSAKNGMNLYRGCQHGCIYCDSRSSCYQMGHDFEDVAVKANAIALLEGGLLDFCDCAVAITAPEALRIRRIMARDGITEGYARMRITAQKQDEYYRGKCDCELNNATESPEEFRRDARLFFERLVEAIQEEKRHG